LIVSLYVNYEAYALQFKSYIIGNTSLKMLLRLYHYNNWLKNEKDE